ncbi:glycosyltransferase [Cytophagaceae bacterium ABcell3]|nr:glycosyltransferase [Cytophagaceae bacterium ABcell3]
MIKGESFICLALNTWDSDHMNTLVQIMGPMSKYNKVLYVDYQFTIKDLVVAMYGNKGIPVRKIAGWDDRLSVVKTKYGSEVYVLNVPPVLPVNWLKNYSIHDQMLRVNAEIVRRSVVKASERLGINDPIVVSGYNPFYGLATAGSFNEKLNVYYCYDEIKGDQRYKYHGTRIEEQYLSKADLVVTTSDALYQSKASCCKSCYVIKNGVDFELFHKASGGVNHGSERKVVAYTGSIDERFHTEVMVHAIEHMPDVDFTFVGRITNFSAAAAMSRYPNVNILGSRAPEEVPTFLKKADVGVIPYLKNEVTSGVYPLKINEYLAAGKPVVMTKFAELNEFEGLVSFVESKEEFLRALKFELESDNNEKQAQRIDTARKNSWEHRVEEFSTVLIETLTEKEKLTTREGNLLSR